ncbi:ArpU family phage packaging/lysis transcriptional regulator [Paenibacillus sp. LC231]|uniref:ArpU family phage packaging/lysis transcriptional regulator n=1 Tax=Paenibacillus sp. LC231 TaxID=1120679 RepID=UPI0013922E14|nr:ArpU family phage packaging/lysis transcriptional regulator [Paenibacillus sp. LC231]
MKQMSFDLPELDREKTKDAVESALLKYRMFKTIDVDEREAKVTASLSDMPRGQTNVTSDQTGDIAAYNIDAPAARKAYCEKVERAVKRLHPKERMLIQERYMKEDYVFDYVIYTQIMGISEGTYYKYRWKAFYKLALILNIAITKNNE